MLMKEEDNILKRVGKENPFRVPDGYFEHLTSKVMDSLPEKEAPAFLQHEPTRWERIKPWLYMAAMFAGAALILRVATWGEKEIPTGTSLAADDSETEEQYISTVLDNSMLDDYSLYVYLTDVDSE